jgi:hypothetical protein
MAQKKSSTDKLLDNEEANHAIKNYTRVPNMLVDGYSELHPQDKWLFVCLVRLCGKEGTRYLSLRFISEKTGFSKSALADNKKDDRPGMIRRLHDAGLIHSEIKRRKNSKGQEEKNAQYHITITDTWALNYAYFNSETCPESGQDIKEQSEPVQNPDATCPDSGQDTCEPVQNPDATCPDSGTIVRLQSKITNNKITESKKETPNVSSLPSPTSLSPAEQIAHYQAEIARLSQATEYVEQSPTVDKSEPSIDNKQTVKDTSPIVSETIKFTLQEDAVLEMARQKHISGLRRNAAHKEYCSKLASGGVATLDDLTSLMMHCWTKKHLVNEDGSRKALYLKNLVNELDGWLQVRQSTSTGDSVLSQMAANTMALLAEEETRKQRILESEVQKPSVGEKRQLPEFKLRSTKRAMVTQ